MRRYIELDEDEIGEPDRDRVKRVVLELDEDGVMNREIGLDEHGSPVHIAPFGGDRGMFDLVAFEDTPSTLSGAEFQRIWNQAVEAKCR